MTGDPKRVVSHNDIPIELWRDTVAVGVIWGHLRDACAETAATGGQVLAVVDAEHPEVQAVEYARLAGDDVKFLITCTEEDAEFARLRLVCWTRPTEP